MLLVDTAPLVEYLKAETTTAARAVRDVLHASTRLALSVVTLSELYYILAAARGQSFAATCIRTVCSQMEVLAIDAEVAEKAGEFKFRYTGTGKKGLPMGDALIAATAWQHKLELLTTDPHFEKIVEIHLRSV